MARDCVLWDDSTVRPKEAHMGVSGRESAGGMAGVGGEWQMLVWGPARHDLLPRLRGESLRLHAGRSARGEVRVR